MNEKLIAEDKNMRGGFTGMVCLLLLTACTSLQHETTRPFPSTLPDELSLSESGGPVPDNEVFSTEYRLTRDGALTRTTEKFVGHISRRTILRRWVTPQTWETFRQKIAPLHLRRWKVNYVPRETIFDGYAWRLRIVLGGHRMESSGSNAAPDPENPAKTIEVLSQKTTGYSVLSAAFDDLWKQSPR